MNVRVSDRRTILFVEGDPIQRHVTAELLREFGFPVVEAATARQAMYILQELSTVVSTLVSDIWSLGDMTGYELAYWTRQHHHRVGIILTTAGHQSVPQDRYYPLLRKPYAFSEIAPMLRVASQRANGAHPG